MNIQNNSRYHEVHARSLRDPEGFWAEAAPDQAGNGFAVRLNPTAGRWY